MALHAQDHGGDPVRGEGGVKVTDLGSDHRLLSDGVEQLAHGATVCPGCAMPVPIPGPVGVGSELACGYCETSGPARAFLVPDVYDTAANEVLLIARID